ncbi:MAG: hypothetical protein H6Q19_1741, partial [Bacteroidetes bacterium]|nr:hypothetical protein [Bacteroidota bacterium]
FPEKNATWNFHCSLIGMSGDFNENYSISISGDTTINTQTYHKLTTPFANTIALRGYKGAIRQDIAAKKVYFVPRNEKTEQLLYDFTLQIGDTVKGYLQANLSQKDTIKSIDSVLVGNSYRKRWLVNSNYNIYFIEGLGSTYGLFEQSPGSTPDFPDFSINCYRENSQTLYPDSQTNCELISSVKRIEANSNQIRILPNPQNGSLQIEFNNTDIIEIKIIDLSSKVIFQQSTTNMKTILIDRLQSGLYILTGKDKTNRLITKKLISCP